MQLTPALIEELRGEFLMLLKNAAKARTMKPETFQVWGKALDRWWKVRMEPILDAATDLGYQTEGSAKTLDRAKRHLSKGLGLPVAPTLTQLRKLIPAWASGLIRQTDPLWTTLLRMSKRTKEELPVYVEESTRLEGLPVVMINSGSHDLYGKEDKLAKVREVLRAYHQAAQARLPLLLRGQLPIHLVFGCDSGDWDHAASYGTTSLDVCVGSIIDTSDGVQILAHEMGHHVYRTFLSRDDQLLWKMVISGDLGTVDLREILKRSKPGEKFPDPSWAKTNPVLYLQLEALRYDGTWQTRGIRTTEDLEEALGGMANPIVSVKRKPVTAYGATNDEEAFCEAVGLLVGYGPKALLPEVRQILRIILPGVRTAYQS